MGIESGTPEEQWKKCKEVLSGFDKYIYDGGFERSKSAVELAGNFCFRYGLMAKKSRKK